LVELAVKGQLDLAPDSSSAIRETLKRLLDDQDRELAASDLAHYVPLAETVSYPEFLDRRARAIASARNHLSKPQFSTASRATPPETGAEKSIVSEELRLTGRIDLLEREGNAIVVRDLKTGNVRGPDGSLAPHIVLQLRLYGLLAAKVFPGKRVRLVIEHQQSEELPFDSTEIAHTEQQRALLLERLAPGAAAAAELATTGAHCGWCDVRHVCPRYRSEAPGLWPVPRTDYPLPLDVWGALSESPRRSMSGDYSLRLRDDGGRHVSIVALDARHGPFEDLLAGERLWFFGLEPRGELRNVANQYGHPTNFRELKTGADERRAYRLGVFQQRTGPSTSLG